LPAARPVPIEQLMSGAEDGQRIEISGIVRAVTITDASANLDQGLLSIEIVSGGYRLHAYSEIPPEMDPQTFVGARVRVKGTAAASFNATLRRFITTKIFVPLRTDFIVEESEPNNPFDEPVLPLNRIAQYRKDNAPGKRVHVKAMVTHQRLGEDLFLQDANGGSLHVKSRQLESLSVGDMIEAVGFPGFDHFLPVLEDAIYRKTSEPRVAVAPRAITTSQVQAGLHHADFVVLRGKLLDRTIRRGRQRLSGNLWAQTFLTLQSDNLIFTAEFEAGEESADLASIPVGSTVAVSGVCFTEIGDDGKLKSLQVLLPTSTSVQILERPSWLTPQRLLIGLGVLFVISIVVVSWTIMVSKKNSALKTSIREREAAQIELQKAHDQLEERVKERTTQLKFQITARKESELQSKATLTERTRLAQELHDTLEQTLTGIALQLDTSAKLFEKKPDGASHHLELARDLVAQSQVEVHRSVWDLRSRALEQFDLPGALMTSARQLTDGTGVCIEVAAKGKVRPLPEIVEENLLRIAQEALANIIKHSGAKRAEIELDFGPQSVVLQVKDDGRGFALENCPGPPEGHFGLLGISERAKRLRGELAIASAPGAGTTVRVHIPLDPAQEPLPADLAEASRS
jgi:signal transduction histidine kinase